MRAHSPATPAGGDGVIALAAAVHAIMRMLVCAAADHTDVSHTSHLDASKRYTLCKNSVADICFLVVCNPTVQQARHATRGVLDGSLFLQDVRE